MKMLKNYFKRLKIGRISKFLGNINKNRDF